MKFEDIDNYCKKFDYDALKNLIDTKNDMIRKIYYNNFGHPCFYQDKIIFWLFFNNYSKYLYYHRIFVAFRYACEYLDLDVVKEFCEKYPQVKFYQCFIDDEIIETFKIDILDYLIENFKYYNNEYISDIIYKSIDNKRIDVFKYYIDKLTCDEYPKILNYCYGNTDYDFIIMIFEILGDVEINFTKYKWNHPKDIKVFNLFVEKYDNFIDSVINYKYLEKCFRHDSKIAIYITEQYNIDIFGGDNYVFRNIFNCTIESVKYLVENYPEIDYYNLDYYDGYLNMETMIYMVEIFPGIEDYIWKIFEKDEFFWDDLLFDNTETVKKAINIFCDKIDFSRCFEIDYDIEFIKYIEENYSDYIFGRKINVSELIFNKQFEYVEFLIDKYGDRVYVNNNIVCGKCDIGDYQEIIIFIMKYFPNVNTSQFIYKIFYTHYDNLVDNFDFLIKNKIYDNIYPDTIVNLICENSKFTTLNTIINKYPEIFQSVSPKYIFDNACENFNFKIIVNYLDDYFDDVVDTSKIIKYITNSNVSIYKIEKILDICDKNNYILDNCEILYHKNCYNISILLEYFDRHNVDYDLDKIYNNAINKKNMDTIHDCIEKYRKSGIDIDYPQINVD